MKTTSSEQANEFVKEGNVFVTPKKLITNKMLEMWTKYSKQEQEDAEKEKKENMLKDGSMMESSQL